MKNVGQPIRISAHLFDRNKSTRRSMVQLDSNPSLNTEIKSLKNTYTRFKRTHRKAKMFSSPKKCDSLQEFEYSNLKMGTRMIPILNRPTLKERMKPSPFRAIAKGLILS